VLIREGQRAALEDAVKRGEIKIVAEPWTPNWDADAAMAATEAALKKAGNKVVAIVASNDNTAGGAIKALEKNGLAGKVLVSGQDADLEAVRRIVQGTQTMTCYKPLSPLAREAASEAVHLAKGEKVEGTATIDNGMKQVQAVLWNPVVIHKGHDRDVDQRSLPHARADLCDRHGRRGKGRQSPEGRLAPLTQSSPRSPDLCGLRGRHGGRRLKSTVGLAASCLQC
jgi:D-xylose transport system substrate-binding protein